MIDTSYYCTYWDEPCGYPNIWVTFLEHADNSFWLLRSLQMYNYPSCDSCKQTDTDKFFHAIPVPIERTDSPYFDIFSRITDFHMSISTRPIYLASGTGTRAGFVMNIAGSGLGMDYSWDLSTAIKVVTRFRNHNP